VVMALGIVLTSITRSIEKHIAPWNKQANE
jgi:hypothetical protein